MTKPSVAKAVLDLISVHGEYVRHDGSAKREDLTDAMDEVDAAVKRAVRKHALGFGSDE